jgi:hypothetical protein
MLGKIPRAGNTDSASLFRLGAGAHHGCVDRVRHLLRSCAEGERNRAPAVLDDAEIMCVFNLEIMQAIRMRSDIGAGLLHG